MSQPFLYHRATSIDDASSRLAAPGTVPLGGGTDLLVAIAEDLVQPRVLVDLRRIPGSREIEALPDGGVRIGASVRIAELGLHDLIRSRFPALAQACDVVATPALRHMGTIGGNLCQRPRCWYYRRGIACLKNGGPTCPAVNGENQYLAILDAGPCYVVHPSDPAVALLALDASIEVRRSGSTRTVAIEHFYTLPREFIQRETVLEPGEWISALTIPAQSSGGVQHYHKLMQRDAWDFALVSVAAVKRPDGDVRVALGGVAPKPWRINSSVEEDVSSGGLDDEAIATLTDRALLDARPLSKNGYKVAMAASLLRQAFRELSGPTL